MVNQQLVEWIKSEEAQGYSPQQLSEYLLKQGYEPAEVSESIKYADRRGLNEPQVPNPSDGQLTEKKLTKVQIAIQTVLFIVSLAMFQLVIGPFVTLTSLLFSPDSDPFGITLLIPLFILLNIAFWGGAIWFYRKTSNKTKFWIILFVVIGLIFILWIIVGTIGAIYLFKDFTPLNSSMPPLPPSP